MKTLGILFLITAALLVVGVIINLSPSGSENRIYKLEESVHESSQNLKKFAEVGRALGYQTGQIDIRSDEDIFSTSSSLKSQREMRVLYFAIAAGILGILGLILVVSQSQPESHHETAVKSQVASLSNTNPIVTQAMPKPMPEVQVSKNPEKIGNIFIYVNDEVAGPYTISEVKVFFSNEFVTYQTLFCLEGSQNWRPLSDILT